MRSLRALDIGSPLEVWLRGAVKYIKIGIAMTIPAIPLLPALDIQGYQIHFYTIFLSVYIMVAKQNIDIGALTILQPTCTIYWIQIQTFYAFSSLP